MSSRYAARALHQSATKAGSRLGSFSLTRSLYKPCSTAWRPRNVQTRAPASRARYVWLNSTTSHDSKHDGARSGREADDASHLRPPQQLAYKRLRPVIDALPGPIDWAIAYGSGVVQQANAAPGSPPPLTDFILATPSPLTFHTSNIRQNPSHYPLFARLLGGRAVAWLQDSWGAGVWYVTMVRIGELHVKYGVISTSRLRRDLENWETLYVAGRLHKPVLPLLQPPALITSLEANARSALSLALLLLPSRFTELELYEQIAGISYSGDPRMSVPGAENPEKVRNIVRGKGALEGFREMYAGMLSDVGVAQLGEKMSRSDGVDGEGDRQDSSDDYSLILSLPASLRQKVAARLSPSRIKKMVDRETGHVQDGKAQPPQEWDDSAFWEGVVDQPTFRETLLQDVRSIIRYPAFSQSFKGLFTAGFRKSVLYSFEKVKKWWRSGASQK